METFRRDIFVGLQPAQWVRILDPLGIPDEQDINHADQYDRAILSAYRGGLLWEPLKGSWISRNVVSQCRRIVFF